jgi:hypothetical protein
MRSSDPKLSLLQRVATDEAERHARAVACVALYFALLWARPWLSSSCVPQHRGLVLTDLLAVLALVLFNQRLKRRERRARAASHAAEPQPFPDAHTDDGPESSL